MDMKENLNNININTYIEDFKQNYFDIPVSQSKRVYQSVHY